MEYVVQPAWWRLTGFFRYHEIILGAMPTACERNPCLIMSRLPSGRALLRMLDLPRSRWRT